MNEKGPNEDQPRASMEKNDTESRIDKSYYFERKSFASSQEAEKMLDELRAGSFRGKIVVIADFHDDYKSGQGAEIVSRLKKYLKDKEIRLGFGLGDLGIYFFGEFGERAEKQLGIPFVSLTNFYGREARTEPATYAKINENIYIGHNVYGNLFRASSEKQPTLILNGGDHGQFVCDVLPEEVSFRPQEKLEKRITEKRKPIELVPGKNYEIEPGLLASNSDGDRKKPKGGLTVLDIEGDRVIVTLDNLLDE